jgi:hypothetical protein
MSKIIAHKTVYHGTISNNLISLSKSIDLKRGSKLADFGQGFYTTTSYTQAKNWAIKRARRFNQFTCYVNVKPVVIVYELNNQELCKLNGKIFKCQDINWAKFIYNNRSKKNNIQYNYDYVFGSVADGNIQKLIESCDNGNLTISELLTNIKYNKLLKYNNQLVFLSKDAVNTLKYIRSKVIP